MPRKAKMSIRYGKEIMCWSNSNDKKVKHKVNESGVPVYIVDIREIKHVG